MPIREFKLSVKVIREGQPRPYADSEYEYEIEAENCNLSASCVFSITEYAVKDFCTRFLRPCKQTRAEWDTKDADSYFHGYYEFSKLGENKYRYYVKEPFCD